jgi:hypothetical protein
LQDVMGIMEIQGLSFILILRQAGRKDGLRPIGPVSRSKILQEAQAGILQLREING